MPISIKMAFIYILWITTYNLYRTRVCVLLFHTHNNTVEVLETSENTVSASSSECCHPTRHRSLKTTTIYTLSFNNHTQTYNHIGKYRKTSRMGEHDEHAATRTRSDARRFGSGRRNGTTDRARAGWSQCQPAGLSYNHAWAFPNK